MFISQKASLHDQPTTSQHTKKGFSLLEIIVVMGLIAVIAGIIYPILNQRRKEAAISQARQMLGVVSQSIDRYHDDTGEYPVTLENLVRRPSAELVSSKWSTGGYLPVKKGEKEAKVPLDPWKRKFVYEAPKGEEDSYKLYSYGPNGPKGDKKEIIHAE